MAPPSGWESNCRREQTALPSGLESHCKRDQTVLPSGLESHCRRSITSSDPSFMSVCLFYVFMIICLLVLCFQVLATLYLLHCRMFTRE